MNDDLSFLPLFSPSELNRHIKNLLEEHFPLIRLQGELSGFKPASSGHWYFSLKDNEALIQAVMFKNRSLSLGFTPSDGQEVIITGSISVYEKRGSYQIICETMELAGSGNLLAQIEERKQRLLAEGLFDTARKKPLPLLPKRVVVITSPTGAVIRDILHVLQRRCSGLDVVIVPAPVQGNGAAEKLAKALKMAEDFALGDVIIIGRGGGSTEDLAAFSEEVLVRAIANCTIPVISAVGHEVDTALSDFAADVRAPTPSAAAEIVAMSHNELERRVFNAGSAIVRTLLVALRHIRSSLRPYKASEMERQLRNLVQPYYMRLDDAKEELLDNLKTKLTETHHRLDSAQRELEACSPFSVLERGYAIIRHSNNGAVITSTQGLETTQSLTLVLTDGTIETQINTVNFANKGTNHGL